MITIGLSGIISFTVGILAIKYIGMKMNSNFFKEYEAIHGHKPSLARRYLDGPRVHHALGHVLFYFMLGLGTLYEVWSMWNAGTEPWYGMILGGLTMFIVFKIWKHIWNLYQLRDEWSYWKSQ